MSFNRVVIDGDWTIYGAGFAGEKRTIKAIHVPSGREFDCANRTELRGRKKTKDGGLLAELNGSSDSPMIWTEFEILDIQHPEPIENVLYTVKKMIEGVSKVTGITRRDVFIGEGKTFRHERATILEYKGNRTNNILPIYKDEIKEYMIKVHKAEVVTEIETDDRVVIEGQRPGTVVAAVDKDTGGCPVFWFNPNKPDLGIVDCNGLGRLDWDTSGKTKILRGVGRKFFYKQLLTGDTVDNYKPNAASEVEFGDVSAYNALNDCETDRQCFEAIKEAYQKMYPEPVEVYGWRGDIIKVDWRYSLSEVWELARMRRSYDDKVTAEEVFTKFGLWSD